MDLSNQTSIGSALLVKVSVPNETPTTFSTFYKTLTIDGVNYVGLGQLLSITSSSSELRTTASDISIGITAIPSQNITLVDNALLRGSPVEVWRYVFNPTTGEALTGIGDNPAGRFFGIVTNFTMDFTMDPKDPTRVATAGIILQASSTVEQLSNKLAGRRTTPEDQQRYFPGDQSMDRVPVLARSNFNFGAPAQ